MHWLIGDPRLDAFLGRLPTFSPAAYLALYPDLATFPGGLLGHFTHHGLWEDRVFATPQAIAGVLARLPVEAPAREPADLPDLLSRLVGESIGLYVHAQSAPTVRLAAELLAAALLPMGLDVVLRDETADPQARQDHCLFFAPHEFFFLPGGLRWFEPAVIDAAILCPTLPVHATSPSRTLPMLAACRAVIDANPQNTALYACCGVAHAQWLGVPPDDEVLFGAAIEADPLAASLPPGLAPPGAEVPWRERALDLCMFGARCTTRDEVLVYGAPILSALRCFAPYPERLRDPLPRRRLGPARTALENHVARNAKVVASIDVAEVGSVDPYGTAILGFGNGALVVTRPLHRHPVFKPGEHYLEESSRGIAALVEWVATTPEGAALGERVAAAGRSAYRHGRYREAAVLDVLALLDRTRRPGAA